jgi:hypothetical protein
MRLRIGDVIPPNVPLPPAKFVPRMKARTVSFAAWMNAPPRVLLSMRARSSFVASVSPEHATGYDT